MSQYQDISCKIGPKSGVVSGPNPKYPMYSYERPSWLFWQGYYEGLIAKHNLTHDEAISTMQSRDVRYMLDFHEDKLKELGRSLA